MERCPFTFNHYRELMNAIKKSKYVPIFFDESDQFEKEIIIRHDVDQDLENALNFAAIENNYGIKSTYFIWLRSPFYNVFDNSYYEYINKILGLGHQIGLHFDETLYNIKSEEDIKKYVKKEIDVIKVYFDIEVKAVSFHRPSKFILNADLNLGNEILNTYHSKFFIGYKYISDSRKVWKEGCLCNYLDIDGLNGSDWKKIHV